MRHGQMTDVMVDLETWGVTPGSAIRSIGAVLFGRMEGLGQEFYQNVDEESCRAARLTFEAPTVRWWSDPERAEAQQHLLTDKVPLRVAITRFLRWYGAVGGKEFWCHGAIFDEPILSAAARACGYTDRQLAWKFWDVRCTRTLFDLTGFDWKKHERTGTHHHALEDAKTQATGVQAALRGGLRSQCISLDEFVTDQRRAKS